MAQAIAPSRARAATAPEVFDEQLKFDPPPEDSRAAAWGAGRTVCVRECDGFFFPLPAALAGGARPSELCSASCPGASVDVYFLGDDGEIDGAVSSSGLTYASMPNAGRYRRQFDRTCTCRKPGDSWAQTLGRAEAMIERRRTDTIVNERLAEQMSRVPDAVLRQRREAARADEAADEAARQALDAQARSAPTMNPEPAGIAVGGGPSVVLPLDSGHLREVPTSDGGRRRVRVLPQGGLAP